MTTTFAAKEIRVSFNGTEVVHGATLVAKPGHVTALLGPNGAGKSTTLRAALGLVRAQGEIDINGRIGLLLDDGGLIPALSGRQHLTAMTKLLGVQPQRVQEVLQLVDMASRCDRRIKTYSLGMKRRIALAGTLLQDPEILVLDEPSSGLDPDGIRWFGQLMRAEAQRGKAVIVATHHLAEAEAIADDIVIIARGETCFSGARSEIRNLEATYFSHTTKGATL
ncbi:ABC transporter ATP-binding protein [Corynebacterium sp. H128]|uniref:ABC transporter ATP-binding protein n=1 Tax=unclassified Corynebacterium TaxID=2624378 RepID=UPI0030A2D413